MHHYVDQLAFTLGDGWAKKAFSLAPDAPFSEEALQGDGPPVSGDVRRGVRTGLPGAGVLGWRGDEASRGAKVCVAIALFPVAIIANYLVMSLGLGVPGREGSVTTSDEAMRPGRSSGRTSRTRHGWGAAYEGGLLPMMSRFRIVKTLLLPIVLGLFLVPFVCGINVQVGPAWGKELTETRVPADLSALRDVPSRTDPTWRSRSGLTCAIRVLCWVLLSEPPGVRGGLLYQAFPAAPGRRLEEASPLERMTDNEAIHRYAADRRIRWYCAPPGRPRRRGRSLKWNRPRSRLESSGCIPSGSFPTGRVLSRVSFRGWWSRWATSS